MTTILLILVGELALLLIGLGIVLELRKRMAVYPPMVKIAAMLLSIPAVVTLLGPMIVVAGQSHQMRYEDSETWPTTTGQITNSFAMMHTSRSGSSYTPYVRYTYIVNNRSYTSTHFSYDRRSYGNSGDAEDDVHPYPAGSTVTVHYNPDKPKSAWIAPTPDSFFQSYTIMGIVVTLVGCVILGVGGAGLWWWEQKYAPPSSVIMPLGK